MSYDIQSTLHIEFDRTVYVQPNFSQFGLQGWESNTEVVLLSNVKIKRPDGTWANVLQVTEVHMRLPDGTWQIFT